MAYILSSILYPLAFSRPHQPIEQRPSQHKPTQPSKHISQPQISQRPIEELSRLSFCLQHKEQYGDHQRSQDVEYEAGVGFETEGAGGDAEEGGGKVADIG
jgi:hypothetical protein